MTRPVMVTLRAYIGTMEAACVLVKTLPSPFEAQKYIDELEACEPREITKLKKAITALSGHDILNYFYIRKELPNK